MTKNCCDSPEFSLEYVALPPLLPSFKFALMPHVKEEKQFLPAKAEPYATGYDVRAAFADKKPLTLRPGQHFKIPLGFKTFCPPGWYYQLHPRSSCFVKKSIHSLIGIVDESWEGQTLWAGQYLPDPSDLGKELVIEYGERIGQIVPVQRTDIIVEEISMEEYVTICEQRGYNRKDNGFGASGRK